MKKSWVLLALCFLVVGVQGTRLGISAVFSHEVSFFEKVTFWIPMFAIYCIAAMMFAKRYHRESHECQQGNAILSDYKKPVQPGRPTDAVWVNAGETLLPGNKNRS